MDHLKMSVPCHFGLESVLSFEVKRLGGENVKVSDGRVSFEGDALTLAKANINIATGERVLVDVGEFEARSFEELFVQLAFRPW